MGEVVAMLFYVVSVSLCFAAVVGLAIGVMRADRHTPDSHSILEKLFD